MTTDEHTEHTTPAHTATKQPHVDSASDSDDDELMLLPDLLQEPEGFRPPSPVGTDVEYVREEAHVLPGTPKVLELHLVARHSLWAHRLWNAGIVLARHLDERKEICRGKRVLELGAAASVPSMIAALNGASTVTVTDWPDPGLIKNIIMNAETNMPHLVQNGTIHVIGYQWGQDTTPLLEPLPSNEKYDVIFLADLIFNHTEHHNLLKTCVSTLSPTGSLYVYFTHHVVKWADRDLKFFEIAQSEPFGFKSEYLESVKASAMFPDDVGELSVRETVHCYRLWRE